MDDLFNNQNENLNEEIKEQPTETPTEEVKSEEVEPKEVNKNEAEFINEPEPQNNTFETDNKAFEPVYNPVNYSQIEEISDYKPMNKGLKVFALILALIIVLTGTTLAGYFAGKNSIAFGKGTGKVVKADLESTPENEKEMSASKVYDEVNPSIVGIIVYNDKGNASQASGIVYSKDGYIITNDHIYSEISNPKFKIHAFDGKEYTAKYVAGDVISDLAVLKVENSNLQPATFGNSDELYMGQKVVAIGRPNDATDISSITSGIISATNRRVRNSSNYSARLIQTDSPINPGSSGGALVNMYGQVVGVTSSKLASVEMERQITNADSVYRIFKIYEGVGYAIPTTVMKRIVEELIKEGKVVTRAKLGITYTLINSVTAEINNYKNTGLLVNSVSEDSELYGKVAKGDIITKINDIAITNDDTVLDIIEQCSAGDTISVTVITSNNTAKTYNVKLSANIGESSYTTKDSSTDSNNSSNPGTFDFPFGE